MRFGILMLGAVMFCSPSVMAAEFCAVYRAEMAVAHQPADDVNLNSVPVKMPDVIAFPVTLDLAKRLGVNSVEMTHPVLMAKVHKNGSVMIDGHDVGDMAGRVCGVSQDGDGQAEPEAINSDKSDLKEHVTE